MFKSVYVACSGPRLQWRWGTRHGWVLPKNTMNWLCGNHASRDLLLLPKFLQPLYPFMTSYGVMTHSVRYWLLAETERNDSTARDKIERSKSWAKKRWGDWPLVSRIRHYTHHEWDSGTAVGERRSRLRVCTWGTILESRKLINNRTFSPFYLMEA